MQDVTTLLAKPPTQHQRRPMSSAELTEEQRNAVGYFFARLRLVNATQYDALMPDEKTEQITKREYAAHLIGFTQEQIDRGLAGLHEMRQMGHPDYRFLDINQAIGLIAHGGVTEGNPARIHKPFAPLQLPDKTAQERSKAAGARTLDSLKSLFPEETA
jgi:hypothetical protein